MPLDHSNAAAAVGGVGGGDRGDIPGPDLQVLLTCGGVIVVAAAAADAVV